MDVGIEMVEEESARERTRDKARYDNRCKAMVDEVRKMREESEGWATLVHNVHSI